MPSASERRTLPVVQPVERRVRHRVLTSGVVALAVALLIAAQPALALTPPPAFTAAARMGFLGGDDWEPAIAADASGHVYAMWTHYVGFGGGTAGDPDPTCLTCGSPHMDVQVSSDNGATWSLPHVLLPTTTRQDDPQIVVDPADGQTVYASFMQDNHASIVVAKSIDHGQSWTTLVVENLSRQVDKDWLAVRGPNIYVVYHTVQKTFVSISRDAGATWTTHDMIGGTGGLGQSFVSGGAVDSNGVVYFAWNGVERSGKAKGPKNLYVTRSTDHGATWTVIPIGTSAEAPNCNCEGYDYWGAQMALDVDAANQVYVLFQASSVARGPQRLYFSRSSNGTSFSAPVDVSLAPTGANNVFPALTAGTSGDVRIAWMDDRNGHDSGSSPDARWNVWYRSSTDGGATWTSEAQLSSFNAGFGYSFATPSDGFLQPYGDYFEMDINAADKTVALWGEGFSYTGPGNVWFARQP
jgi:hypothetical protein